MQTPLQIVSHDVDVSEAIETAVRGHVAKLEEHFDRITSCRVVVAAPHRRHRHGKLYSVSIFVTVPRKEIVVNKNQHENHAHEDLYVALHDSFKAAGRQLEEYARRLRGDVKHHEPRRPRGEG